MLNRELPELINYRPFWEVDMDEGSIEDYLDRIDRTAVIVEESLLGSLKRILRVAVWHFAAWKAARATAVKKQRLEEFESLTALAIELRSLKAQLSYAALLPQKEALLLPSTEAASPTSR